MELRKKKQQHIPSLAEMGLRHVTPRVKRPTSMAVSLPSWAVRDSSREDTTSADSIAVRPLVSSLPMFLGFLMMRWFVLYS